MEWMLKWNHCRPCVLKTTQINEAVARHLILRAQHDWLRPLPVRVRVEEAEQQHRRRRPWIQLCDVCGEDVAVDATEVPHLVGVDATPLCPQSHRTQAQHEVVEAGGSQVIMKAAISRRGRSERDHTSKHVTTAVFDKDGVIRRRERKYRRRRGNIVGLECVCVSV